MRRCNGRAVMRLILHVAGYRKYVFASLLRDLHRATSIHFYGGMRIGYRVRLFHLLLLSATRSAARDSFPKRITLSSSCYLIGRIPPFITGGGDKKQCWPICVSLSLLKIFLSCAILFSSQNFCIRVDFSMHFILLYMHIECYS